MGNRPIAFPLMRPMASYFRQGILPALAIALFFEPDPAQAMPRPIAQPPITAQSLPQATEPMDFLDQPEGVINCVGSGTSNAVPWDHRFTYWLSGVAQFDAQGNMQPVSASSSKDWLLTLTDSRFPNPRSYDLTLLETRPSNLRFAFPAVSREEWEAIDKRPSENYAAAFSYDEASFGLYVAIRNTQSLETARQMFQVIHYLSEDVSIVSEAAPCFVGPRPPSPLDVSNPMEAADPSSTRLTVPAAEPEAFNPDALGDRLR